MTVTSLRPACETCGGGRGQTGARRRPLQSPTQLGSKAAQEGEGCKAVPGEKEQADHCSGAEAAQQPERDPLHGAILVLWRQKMTEGQGAARYKDGGSSSRDRREQQQCTARDRPAR